MSDFIARGLGLSRDILFNSNKILLICSILFGMSLKLLGATVESEASPATNSINEARNCDSLYSTGSQVSQPDAIEKYEKALKLNPTSEQRLEIYSRVAALTSYCLDTSKGERPDFAKSVYYSTQVYENYPKDELKVFEAIISMTCGNTAQKEFQKAVECSKYAFEYDTSVLDKDLDGVMSRYWQINDEISKIDKNERMAEGPQVKKLAAEMAEQRTLSRQIKDKKKLIEEYQYHTVNQLNYAAVHISPLVAEAEMRALIKQYPGTHISGRAGEKLDELMERNQDVWLPEGDQTPYESSIKAASPSVAINTVSQGSAMPAETSLDKAIKDAEAVKKVQNIKLDNESYLPKQSRASPNIILIIIIAGTAAIFLIAYAVKRFYKNSKS